MMIHRLPAWFPIVLLALLATLTFWLDSKVQSAPSTRDAPKRHDPDHIVESFSATRLGLDGTPRYVLSARRMFHYPDDDSTHLEEPQFTATEPGQPAARVKAKTGVVTRDSEDVYFKGDVLMVREPFGNQDEIKVSTSYLHIIPDEEAARTHQLVIIRSPHATAEAIGLEFDNKTGTIKLLSKVKVRYAQKK